MDGVAGGLTCIVEKARERVDERPVHRRIDEFGCTTEAAENNCGLVILIPGRPMMMANGLLHAERFPRIPVSPIDTASALRMHKSL